MNPCYNRNLGRMAAWPPCTRFVFEEWMALKVWQLNPHAGGRSIPESMRRATTTGIIEHANTHFAGHYAEIVVRYRAQFCYVDANLEPAAPPTDASNSL